MTLLTLDQAAAQAPAEVGGKARGLARLAGLGLPVPDALVLPASAHGRWLRDRRLARSQVQQMWRDAAALGLPLAVRSSAADEDGTERSAAGQYESVMDVRSADGLAAAVERCYRSADGSRAGSYRASPGPGAVAVVVQREIEAQRAGVAFSLDPVSGSRECVVIEAVFGHGEGIVSGELAPDRYLVSRRDDAVRARVADKPSLADGRGRLHALAEQRRTARVLRDHEARSVAELVIAAERGFATPVDVEFCLRGETLWLLQCRPITALDGTV